MKVLSRKQIFTHYKSYELDHGLTIKEILCVLDYPERVHPYVEVRINGYKIEDRIWSLTRPNENAVTSVSIVPAGNSNDNTALATVATIALVAALGPAAVAAGFTAGKFGYGAFVAAGTLLGSQLINNMFPPPLPELDSFNRSRGGASPAITGQSNAVDIYGPVIRSYGTNRVFPRVVAEPFIYYLQNDQYLVAIYDFGIGEQEIQEGTLKIGDTELIDYNAVDYNIVTDPNELSIFTQVVNTEAFNVALNNQGDGAIRTSPPNSESVEVNIRFTQGLIAYFGNTFAEDTVNVGITLKIKEVGSSTWKDFNDFDYELSSGFGVRNRSDFTIAAKPDSDTLVSSYGYTGPYGFLTIYNTRAVNFNSDVLKYRTTDEFSQATQSLVIGDKVYFGNQVYTVIEILPSTGPEDNYYDVRLDRVVNYTTTYSIVKGLSVINTGSGSVVGDPENQGYEYKLKCVSDSATINVRKSTATPFGLTVKINPKEGNKQWNIWMTYQDKTFNRGSNSGLQQENSSFVWQGIKGYRSQSPINTNVSHTYLELKIKATDQLNGQLDNLSAVCTSVLDYYDPINNVWKRKPTNNPAWIYADILTGAVNQRAISKSQLDTDSLVAWANYCDTNTVTYNDPTTGFDNVFPFECNFVLDYFATVKQILNQVTNSARATISVNNGKYGVVIDEQRETPTQMFNERNISSFSSSREYTKIPDGIKCFYIDPNSNWQKNEVIAYNDGFDENTATLFEELDVFGANTIGQAWRQGRYFLAQKKLRQETVSIEVDFENLVCSRGDLVYLSHDVMKNGGTPGRVVAINGNEVTLDVALGSLGGSEVLRVRKRATDKIEDSSVLSFVDTNTVELDDVSNIQIDDLAVFGQTNLVTQEFIVKSISFASDYKASLELTEYNEDIYSADSGAIPAYAAQTVNVSQQVPSVVTELSYDYSVDCHDSEKRYIYVANLSWEKPIRGAVEVYEIYLSIDGQQQLAGITRNSFFRVDISGLRLGEEHTFKVLAVDGNGGKLPLQGAASVSFIPTNDSSIPADIKNFNSNLLTETIALNWDLVNDCDIDRYYIKFSPNTTSATWAQSTLVTSTGPTQNTVQVPIRTGTYFIKARDWAGNQSATAAFVVTQIPEILNVDFISEVNAPVWEGTSFNTSLFGSSLTLRTVDNFDTFVADEGEFVFKEVFDLGDIYTARFTSNVIASGFEKASLMVNWITLASVDPIGGSFTDDDWNVSTFIRARNSADAMVDWSTLTEVEYLSLGSEAKVSPWQKFTNADFTGRIFQLKINLTSGLNNVSPIVDDVNIIANWVDRIEEGRDEPSGVPIVFSNAFINIPSLQITAQENISPGDYYIITNKTVSGFTVQFYDAGDNPISSPKFDWIAKGFGKNYTEEELNY